jgi:hypothetical protein
MILVICFHRFQLQLMLRQQTAPYLSVFAILFIRRTEICESAEDEFFGFVVAPGVAPKREGVSVIFANPLV